ncbi:putative protein S-acyltransferase 12 [Citrus sinensis]|nr:putative protein S-acyltransferase 12 [Citrus sinensis]
MDINLFKLCSGLKVLGYFMILLVAAIIAVSYYAVVVITCGPQLLRGGVHSFFGFSIIILFHILLVMLVWSYVMVVFWDPGSVPENWRSVSVSSSSSSGVNLEAGTSSQSLDNVGPDARGPSRFIKFFGKAKNHSSSPANLAIVFLAFVINLAFALSLLCFIVMHSSLVSSNTTSIEVYEKKRTVRWKYDLGRKKNFEQVFGTNKALWFFPLFSKEDSDSIPALHGLDFPTC